ncbi:oligosaccharyl transferase glycoprotein complex, beta subunit [Dimargaris cristalligena]|uniref:Dolichyl-diphosphooligosaccharide--protein glycosyltransferase subunit WBP1 n=1 Tax=Dimargaris cristalligena TaxID=215637 RepID=A0A4P9ZRK9_9FUNG|nr:oligosaccharyl transferase glycoprotein complex, beta subunit [Dimargaris cristalligena]RKP36176.1 Dolichyl-diphosphooligosaccharide--protein glycosyltransferase subunit WBP1 [Dimargaris cristalligena]|eukprot:RKP36176.1 Dolichyl-diphosphooligosaccharide--protein glycosyltransferase subunit WBP1 [Dimargaris cristalligena]
MRFFHLLLAATLAYTSIPEGQAKSLTGDRALLVLPKATEAKPEDYGRFVESLKSRGFSVTFQTATSNKLNLFVYGERQFDHLVLLAPKAKRLGNGITAKSLVEFIDDGGNIVMAAGSDFGGAQRDFAKQLGIDFDLRGNVAVDHFHYLPAPETEAGVRDPENHTRILTDQYTNSTYIVGDQVRQGGPILYQGVGHRHMTNSQPTMLWSVLTGYPTTYSFDTSEGQVVTSKDSLLSGSKMHLVSAFQARNNARVMVVGSTSLFSDAFFATPVPSSTVLTSPKPNGNDQFVRDLTEWTFQEKSVVRVNSVSYHVVGPNESDEKKESNPSANPGSFRVSDRIKYSINLSEYYADQWHPAQVNQLQFEAVMLDPYVRQTLEAESRTGTAAVYSQIIDLPDVYGVFTFKVDFLRRGLSHVKHTDVVPILPFKHNEYDRYLVSAYPYYISAGSLMVSFLVFCGIWIFNGDSTIKVKKS